MVLERRTGRGEAVGPDQEGSCSACDGSHWRVLSGNELTD